VGTRVALVGSTGSGKTTTAHLLLGLLQPQRGCLTLDGLPLTDEKRPAWQASCAQVPQLIQLLGRSVQANVAFGIPSPRPATVSRCDRIYALDNGRVKAAGRFEKLRQTSPSFAEPVRPDRL